jgi:hypothetical protein
MRAASILNEMCTSGVLVVVERDVEGSMNLGRASARSKLTEGARTHWVEA